jgi:GTP cyclohydrolase I
VRLEARRAYARFDFPYFLRQSSPKSGAKCLMGYPCSVIGAWENGRLDFTLGVDVPVMTVCPCSKAISDEGAHSQRTSVRINAKFKGFLWLEALIEIAERSGSSPVYTLLKREVEKFVTEGPSPTRPLRREWCSPRPWACPKIRASPGSWWW